MMPNFKAGIGEKNGVIMTDKQIIETFRKIKEYCTDRECYNCKFDSDYECQIIKLKNQLDGLPYEWNMKAIERIIKHE